jgi:phosphatidate cytidylyltransferase
VVDQAAPKRSNLAERLLTAAVVAPFLLWTLYLGPSWAFPIVVGLTALLGAAELFAMVAPRHGLTMLWGVAATAGVITTLWAGRVDPLAGLHADPGGGSRSLIALLIALTVGGLTTTLVGAEPIDRAAQRAGWAVAGPLYMGALFGALGLLFQRPYGGSWVVFAMLCGFWSDTGGYFVGRAWGKTPLNRVSPKKTVEGSIGGLAASLVGGLLAHFWFLPVLGLLPAVLLSLGAAAAGQVGDLCESLIKRSTDVKDSGNILPGHGGILDRSDALVFASAVVWAYAEFLH